MDQASILGFVQISSNSRAGVIDVAALLEMGLMQLEQAPLGMGTPNRLHNSEGGTHIDVFRSIFISNVRAAA